jgi:flavin reductase (DIM6/NTAB) family NADH-FMN oxidoreductase RutF
VFYRPQDGSGLPEDPLNQLVLPRPIGWITSLDPDGRVNLAPFSFFNLVAYRPPQVLFSATGAHVEGGLKDSPRNIVETGEFVANLATYALREAVNLTSTPAPRGVDELALAGLTAVPAVIVAPPRIAESPVNLECRLVRTVELLSPAPERPNTLVVGEVVGIHITDEAIVGGRVSAERLDPISRLGYDEYARLGEVFRLTRPGWPV